VEGRTSLLEFCREHRIRDELCGKVVVASDESELQPLDALREPGLANGVVGLELLDESALAELESAVRRQRLWVLQAGSSASIK
jgi:L-2-hydroxyglutarate oxidase LhgO